MRASNKKTTNYFTMLTDDELKNYLDELGVLDDQKGSKMREATPLETHEMISQLLASEAHRTIERTKQTLPVENKRPTSRWLRPLFMLLLGCFLSGLASGIIIGSMRSAPLHKMSRELAATRKALEKINPPPSRSETIDLLSPPQKVIR